MTRWITCPYCGYRVEDSLALGCYDGDNGVHTCENCEREYSNTTRVDITYYITENMEEDQ